MLNVGIHTPNLACLGECGRKPLQVLILTRYIKYWIKLVHVHTDNRYTKTCYDIVYNVCEMGRITWTTKIRTLLYNYCIGNVWANKGVGNIEVFLREFKQRISDICFQQWSSDNRYDGSIKVENFQAF